MQIVLAFCSNLAETSVAQVLQGDKNRIHEVGATISLMRRLEGSKMDDAQSGFAWRPGKDKCSGLDLVLDVCLRRRFLDETTGKTWIWSLSLAEKGVIWTRFQVHAGDLALEYSLRLPRQG